MSKIRIGGIRAHDADGLDRAKSQASGENIGCVAKLIHDLQYPGPRFLAHIGVPIQDAGDCGDGYTGHS